MVGPDSRHGFAPTSLTLLERARGDDAVAWHRLVDLYGPLVHYWCRRAGLGGTDISGRPNGSWVIVAPSVSPIAGSMWA